MVWMMLRQPGSHLLVLCRFTSYDSQKPTRYNNNKGDNKKGRKMQRKE
jgi:hypothetical protein